MSSSTEICNIALSHLGSSKRIQSLDSDKGQEAASCRQFYEIARDEVLENFPWPFAQTQEALALVSENPTPEWTYAYQYPSNASNIVKIPSGAMLDSNNTRIPYKIVYGDSGKLIYTNQRDAEVIYTKRVTDVSRFSATFTIALSFKIAGYIAATVTGGDPFSLKEKADKSYRMIINQARNNALNEQAPDVTPDSEFITARD